ncbi:unnamed protein product [Pneumocystis jirovecii]|uniref:SANT domain-containing protein n=2 Tax=Pneumocystis jirovecii TaxID=42068 RepID=L0PAD8_PNEJI|nr:uncharacterized protein T551_01840 [Pneumocystis jirovecii RU7]KTW30557.1 hypothetical protein T551_01840 [Pneumocystis jirovecii RU7]CCJ28590.1 unnamed protein product [Pneumocystis jirovecii]
MVNGNVMEKKSEKDHESFQNNTLYNRENRTAENRNERLFSKRHRSLSHQSYQLEKHNQRFSSCPNTIPREPRYSYAPLYQHGKRKSISSSFSHSYCPEKYPYLSLHQTHNHLDLDCFSEQVRNNIHDSNKYEKNMNENEYKKEFSGHQSYLNNNTSVHKYYDQPFNSYIPMKSSKMNRVVKETMHCKGISREEDWDKKESFYGKNTTKKLSHSECKKDDNYDLKTISINSPVIETDGSAFSKISAAERKNMIENPNNVHAISFDSNNSLNKSSEGKKDMFSEHKFKDVSFQDKAKSPLFSPPVFSNDIENYNRYNSNNHKFFSETQEFATMHVENKENINELIQERFQFMDLKKADFNNVSLHVSDKINDHIISKDFLTQDDKGLIQDVYNKIQKIDKAILTCKNHLYEIENRKLQTINLNNEDKKETIFSMTKFPGSLSISDFLYVETNLCSKIYSENKEKAKQNCIKFSYIKIYNDSLKEYPFFKENELKHERLRPLLFLYISQKNKKMLERNKILQLQYEKYQNSWESQVEKLDNIKKTKKQENERSGFFDAHLDNLSLRSFRRGQGLNYGDFVRSDADFEDIIAKLGVEDDRVSRAAVIPPMISNLSETIKYQYDDRNGIVEDPISSFHYPTWIDVWTVEEHELFKQLFIKYPQKNFGLIASNIPNKTISQCVLHYYRTKKQENYKSLVISRNSDKAKRKGRGRSSRKMEKVKASSLLADLQPSVINDDMDDD